jgi:hypothetical protein
MKLRVVWVVTALLLLVVVALVPGDGTALATPATGSIKLTPTQQRLLSGFASSELQTAGLLAPATAAAQSYQPAA